jgi:hypothetical protein
MQFYKTIARFPQPRLWLWDYHMKDGIKVAGAVYSASYSWYPCLCKTASRYTKHKCQFADHFVQLFNVGLKIGSLKHRVNQFYSVYITRLQAGRSRDRVPMRWIFFNWPNPSSCNMALGWTQPLTEMSTRNLRGGKGRTARKADKLTAICEPTV